MSAVVNDLDSFYNVIPFSLEHYHMMKALFKSAFGISITYGDFCKRFDTSTLGGEVIGYIAIHKASQSPAAYYGVFPVKVFINHRAVLVAQSGDTMTHENHRKKGLFVWLAKMTFGKCQEKGIAFVFGQPNKFSYHGLVNNLGFSPLDFINSYDLKLKVKTLPIAKVFLRLGLFRSYVAFAKLLLSGITLTSVKEFINPTASGLGRVCRDSDYLHYKQGVNKIFVKINKVIAWIGFTDVLWIGDFNDYRLVDEKVVNKLKTIASILGYNTIRFNYNAGLAKPSFLRFFKTSGQEASCFLYIDKGLQGSNLILTAVDFDTW